MRRILFLLLLFCICFSYCQDIEVEVNEPFLTAYQNVFNICTHSYDDLMIFQADWGLAFFAREDDDSIVEISRLYCDIYYPFVRSGDYLYYCTTPDYNYMSNENNRVVKVDISDPYSPFISDELELDVSIDITSVHIIDDYLFVIAYNAFRYFRIEPDEFCISGSYDINTHGYIIMTAGNYLLTYNTEEQFVLYESGADSLEVVADNFDLFEAHQNNGIRNIWELSENIICTAGGYNFVIWDISDPANWEQLEYWEGIDGEYLNNNGDLAFSGNTIYISSSDYLYSLELDENYEVLEEYTYSYEYSVYPVGIATIEEYLIMPSGQGIMEFEIMSGEIEWAGFLEGEPGYINHHLIGDSYFYMSNSPDNYLGLKMYNLSNIANPEYAGTYLENNVYFSFNAAGSYFIFKNYIEGLWDIYKYEDEEMHLIISNSESGINEVKYSPFTDEGEEGALYAYNYNFYNLKKYEGDNAEPVLDLEFPEQKLGFIKDGMGYFLTCDDETADLKIYDGFADNEPVLINQYSNVITSDYAGIRYIDEDYLAVVNPIEETIVYGYNESELTGRSFILQPPEASSAMFIDNYLTGFADNKLYFYEISQSTNGFIEPELFVPLCHRIFRVIHKETDSGDYLICFSFSAVSIVSVSVTSGMLECEIVESGNAISSYPNPFNPSTTLEYSVGKSGNVEMSIYNVRGQKVRTLVNENQEAGNYEVKWNGKDDHNHSLASGIYFVIMKAGESCFNHKLNLLK